MDREMPKKLRVLIFPYESGYAAACLETSHISVGNQPAEAARDITRLLEGNTMSALLKNVPFGMLIFDAPAQYREMWGHGVLFRHTPSLAPRVKELIPNIEYRILSSEMP